jgi:ATP-dependent Clp protease ATP-binding subunit ClpX
MAYRSIRKITPRYGLLANKIISYSTVTSSTRQLATSQQCCKGKNSKDNRYLCRECGSPMEPVSPITIGPIHFTCLNCNTYHMLTTERDAQQIQGDVDFKHNTLNESETLIKVPKEIKEHLDRFVIGQDYAKKILSVAVYKHYNRINHNAKRRAKDEKGKNIKKTQSEYWSTEVTTNESDNLDENIEDFDLEKSNIMIVGPTGCGKTHVVKNLAKALDVPFCQIDCTTLTQAGYVGADVEIIAQKLVENSNNNLKNAQRGICYLDEVDKLASRSVNLTNTTRDVSGEGVQQALLKVIEGSQMDVKVGKDKSPVTFDTTDVLFICSGAFAPLPSQIARRVNKKTLGFSSTQQEQSRGIASKLRSREEKLEEENGLYRQAEGTDFVKFGLIPEFVGRIPIVAPIEGLTQSDLIKILTEPENALVKQFIAEFKLSDTELILTDEALKKVAETAIEKGTGARGLRSILEKVLLDPQYEIPGSDIIKVIVNGDAVMGKQEVVYIRKETSQQEEPHRVEA